MRGEIFYYEQTKKVPFILSVTVYQLPGSQSCNQGKSWYIPDFIYSLCIKFEFSFHTGKFHNRLQSAADRTADSHFKKEL